MLSETRWWNLIIHVMVLGFAEYITVHRWHGFFICNKEGKVRSKEKKTINLHKIVVI